MALCLTFKEGESATLTTPDGEEIQVMYMERHGKQVRLLFGCRPEVKIIRDNITGKAFQTRRAGERAPSQAERADLTQAQRVVNLPIHSCPKIPENRWGLLPAGHTCMYCGYRAGGGA